MQAIKLTKKGVFIRRDIGFGLLVFSPFSGLFFAIAENYVNDTVNFLNNKKHNLPSEIIRNLSVGYNHSLGREFEIINWLPQKSFFNKFTTSKPIVINWLISNKCNFKCNYCYAGDVIDKPLTYANVKSIANDILDAEPLAVVLSGGEPLLEVNKLYEAFEILGNKVGIILDTNGIIIDEKIIALLKKYHGVVRISVDSFHNEINQKIRPPRDNAINNVVLSRIVYNIMQYKKADIPILIHTVVSSANKNNLDDLYDKLTRLGINGWRIFPVVTPNDHEIKSCFEKLMITGRVGTINTAKEDIMQKISIFSKSHESKSNFSLQIIQASESAKNSVVLVLPDGKFYTENVFRNCKIEINKYEIFKYNDVDLRGHYERYLGKI